MDLSLLLVDLLSYDTFTIGQLSLRLIFSSYQILRESQQKHLIQISTAQNWESVKQLGALKQDFPKELLNADSLSTAPGG